MALGLESEQSFVVVVRHLVSHRVSLVVERSVEFAAVVAAAAVVVVAVEA